MATMIVLVDMRPAPTVALIPVPVLRFAADECFVHLNDAAKLVHVHLNEGNANAMAQIPSRLVGAETSSPPVQDKKPARRAGSDLHLKSNLSWRIKLIWSVHPWLQKYSASHFTQIKCISSPSCPTEGRLAIVTNAG